YTPEEIRAISATCKELGLNLHMDGARFSNACAFLGCSPADLTWKAGVDVLCFGGTKNGMAVGEAILFFNHKLAEDFDYRCKQAGQLASKMRFLSAPWVGILENDAWLKYARHANHCAQLLAELVSDIPGVELMFPVQANGVFLQLSEPAIAALTAKGWRFYTFIGNGGARFMCSWDTEEERVRELAADIREVMSR
ncbi:MAG: threonine aldolase family protein, partial [Pseudomonas fluorescens]